MYGGLATTTSTVPSRSGNAVGHVALPQVDPGAGEVAHRPAVGALVELDGVHPGLGHLGGDRQRDGTGPGAEVDDDGFAAAPRATARAASTAQPASTSVSGRGTKTPGPTASSR